MANRKATITYGGLSQDVSKAKFKPSLYFDAKNIKLTPVEGQTFGALSNAYGNQEAVKIPIPVINKGASVITYGTKSLIYINPEIDKLVEVGGTQEIIGHITTTKGVILFTTDSNGTDCLWEIKDLDKDILDLDLLYLRNLGFNREKPIQAVYNYENELIQKVYWVDGENYLRFVNIKESVENDYSSNLIDLPVASVNSRSTIDISKPTVEDGRGGGVHTAGVIQYGYTLYNLNGAETALSPISDLFPLDKGVGEGGGNINEVVGSMPIVVIEDLDTKYEFVKVFSIKYTEFNGLPEVTLIYDGVIGNYDRFTLNDTGTKNLANLGIAELLFLGADPMKPKHIVSKDNMLFAANNTVTAYKLDIDTRAYSYNKAGTSAPIYNNVIYTGTGDIPFTGEVIDAATTTELVPTSFDCVNLDFDTYRYQSTVAAEPGGSFLLEDTSFSATIAGEDNAYVFQGLAGSHSQAVSNTCDLNNVTPKSVDLPVGPKAQILTDSHYLVSFLADEDLTDADSKIARSSRNAYVQIFSNINSSTVLEEIELPRLPYIGFDSNRSYGGSFDATAGQAYQVILRTNMHYNNDVCIYQGYDPAADGEYTGDGPFVGPNDLGLTQNATASIDYEYFSLRTSTPAAQYTLLPLVATNGETTIANGVYVADYSGLADATIDVNINMNGLGSSDANQYSIGLFKNGAVIDSQSLNLVNAGIITRTFYMNNVSITAGDEISLQLINNNGTVFYDTLNMVVGGSLDLTRSISGGSNGEGGTGLNITYELTRTDEGNLGIPLRVARFFKDNEIYRIGVVFFNNIGQASEAKWIADFKAPQGNLEGQYNTLLVQFTNAFYEYINTLDEEQRPTNWSVVRALRNSTDQTVISQGLLTGMFVQDYTKNYEGVDTDEEKAAKNTSLVKTPIPLTRGYGQGVGQTDSYYPIFPTNHNWSMNYSSLHDPSRAGQDQDPGTGTPRDRIVDEIYKDAQSDEKRQQSWQYTKLFQMHSPEATFNMPINTASTDQLHVLGYMKRNTYDVWDYNIDTVTFGPQLEDKTRQFQIDDPITFYPYMVGGYGIIGPSYRSWSSGERRPEYYNAGIETEEPAKWSRRTHVYKTFLPLKRANNVLSYDIYNRPEVTNIGQGLANYNNDPSLQYTNKLTSVVSDAKSHSGSNKTSAPAIQAVQSEGSRCLTLALGDTDLASEDRPGLDDLYNDLNTGEWDVELFGEIRKENSFVYAGSIYGGYDVSSRSRTEYVSIGDVQNMEEYQVQIMSPGDTFVQTFRNTRLTKVPGTVYTTSLQVMVETLEYLVETTVNLEERNDSSLKNWDTIVDPTAEEGTNYNRVYSTDAVIKTYTTDSLKIREIDQAETEVMASKTKVPGEFVESWVDFLPNEVLYLDGKYGPINNVISHFDELYAFQDFAVAKLAVNPRVQTQGQDGVTIELGKGGILYDSQYLSTQSGAINKWGIVSTNSGLYYADTNNKQLMRVAKSMENLSDNKGMHSYLKSTMDRDELRTDNPVIGSGMLLGYDGANGDVYAVAKQDKEFNLSFNEKVDSYTSFYDFVPTRFISKGERFFTVPDTNDSLYLHYAGDYQTYYGTKFESYVTLLVHTEHANTEKVFNSIEFDSEVRLDDVDIADSTIDTIEAWTDYQASGVIPLVMNTNIKRRFRTWRADIPRQEDSRNRLRDKWIYIKLGFNPSDNKKLVLHDIIIGYSETRR